MSTMFEWIMAETNKDLALVHVLAREQRSLMIEELILRLIAVGLFISAVVTKVWPLVGLAFLVSVAATVFWGSRLENRSREISRMRGKAEAMEGMVDAIKKDMDERG